MRVTSPTQFIRDVLRDGLWHTTSPDRFEMIKCDGALRAEPQIPDQQRHKTANGSANYPFVRHLGGISLFSFRGFASADYQRDHPVSTWAAFVPIWHGWPRAIWIEIDRSKAASAIIDPDRLLQRWKSEEAYGHTIMPHIEAAHIGDLPASAFRSALVVTKASSTDWNVEPAPLRASPSAPAPR